MEHFTLALLSEFWSDRSIDDSTIQIELLGYHITLSQKFSMLNIEKRISRRIITVLKVTMQLLFDLIQLWYVNLQFWASVYLFEVSNLIF